MAESRLSTEKYRRSIDNGIKHLIDSESSDGWSENSLVISESLLAIMKYDNMAKVKTPMVNRKIFQLLGSQSREHTWDDSVKKTVSCILVYAESLGYKQIKSNKINYWKNFRPTSAHFSWDQYPQPTDQEILVIGKMTKIQQDLSPTTLEEFKAELSWDPFNDTVNNKLHEASNAADEVRKRSVSIPTISDSGNLGNNYVIKTLEDVGKDLYTQLLQHGEHNRRYEKELAHNKVDHITITPDNQMAVIPWELIYDGNDFCCLKYSVGRLLKGTRNIPNTPTSNRKLRVLLVGDPSGDLIDANKEIQIIQKYFENDWTELDVFTNETFNVRDGNFRTKFLSVLRENKYDIIHYAGHADFDLQRKKSYLYFQKPPDSSTDKVSALEVLDYIQSSGSTPKIVFFNACSSAARDNTDDPQRIKFDNKFANLARDFVKGFSDLNVPAYVGALWPIHNTEAAEFAKIFYESIKHGCTIGDAIRLSRIESFLNHPDHLTWASFILYGDPARKIEILREIHNV